MAFSSLARALSRSARSRSPSGSIVGGYRLRLGDLIENPLILSHSGYKNAELGFIRSYLTSLGANNAVLQGSKLVEWRFLLSRPEFRRLYSSESSQPKKNYENYYPKDKKEIPKGDENSNKSDSKRMRSFLLYM